MATLDNDDKNWLRKNLITRSNKDLDAIKSLVKVAVQDAIEEQKLVTKDDIKHLPTKEEFHSENAKLMKELKIIREEQPILSNKVSQHSDRLDNLEKIHPQGQHVFD
jgi:hypothetical protein